MNQLIFDKIYRNKCWSFAGDGSGIGSCPRYNKNMRDKLSNFVIEKGIKTFFDVPCGSCKWSMIWLQELKFKHNYTLDSYFGMDVSMEALSKSYKNIDKVRQSSSNIETIRDISHVCNTKIHVCHGDFTSACLPLECDLLFCRDALQHLSFDNIWKSLRNFAHCRAKWYIIGGYVSDSNVNIRDGRYFELNISHHPFNLVPDKIISEDNDKQDPQKHFYIFSGGSFRAQLEDTLFKN
jgi:hypothetical protein